MNQLKHIFGLPITISQSVRSSSISRSAGSSGRDVKRSRDILTGPRSNDHSPEPRLTDKSYARLIADYSKAFEVRNTGTKCNVDPTVRGINVGFFPKTPFERLARIPSVMKVKNGGNNNNPCSLNESPSGRAQVPSKNVDKDRNVSGILDETDVVEQVTERAEWLDKMVEARRAKRAAKNDAIFHYFEEDAKKMVHPLVDKTEKKIPISSQVNANNDSVPTFTRNLQNNIDVNDEYLVSNVEKNSLDSKNVSVTVKPFQESDAVENKFSSANFGDNATFVVTVTEESSSSHSEPLPLRHIDLRINGEPATGVDTVIRKVEKFDVVSLAEKIEIRIPVLAESGRKIDNDEPRVSTSTINLCISSRGNNSMSSAGYGKIHRGGGSGTRRSRPGSAHSSTFYVSKLKNTRKVKAPRSKAIPWWTTEESFRRSEIIPARSSESANVTKEAKISTRAKVAARGNNRRADERDAKEIAISDAKMRMKTLVTEPASSGQRLRTKRKAPTSISKIIENELRKKSEEKQKNLQQLIFSSGVTKPMAKHETKVESTTSNEPKKRTSSAIVDATMPAKSDRVITPTLDKVSKKMLPTTRESVQVSGAKSTTRLRAEKENDKATNDNLSTFSNTKESVFTKPINIVAKNNNDNKTSQDGGTMNAKEEKKPGDSVPPKMRSEPRPEVSFKSAIGVSPQLPKTYGSVKPSPATRPSAGAVNRHQNQRVESQNQKDQTTTNSNDAKHTNVKNPTIIIKPIEKKKDGTLIDYGLTVPTRKKSERKLPDSQSPAAVRSKKTPKKEEPAVMAIIKEVIPRKHKDFCSSINRGIVYPAKLKQNGTKYPT